jgi:SpoVK/Ycf46/Vps4 family AAA+-type ATPase
LAEKHVARIFNTAEGSNVIVVFDEPTRCSTSAQGCPTPTTATRTSRPPTYCRRWRATAPPSSSPRTSARTSTTPFLRRLDFVIDFPFPEDDDRRRIWQLPLLDQAPVGDDVDLDFLATRFKLCDGAIRNCWLAAAFIAAEEGGPSKWSISCGRWHWRTASSAADAGGGLRAIPRATARSGLDAGTHQSFSTQSRM